MQKEAFEKLMAKFLQETLSPEELAAFLTEVRTPDNQDILNDILTQKLENKAYCEFYAKDDLDEMLKLVLKKAAIKEMEENASGPTAVVTMRPRKNYFSFSAVAAAAIITGIILTGAFYLFFNNSNKDVAVIKQPIALTSDVQPGGNKAVLTLADGTTIILDSAKEGALSQQGNAKVIKLTAGQLAYNSTGNTTEVVYNTISTPKGGTYQVILPDETKVWLNAASSLRFPTTFTGKERSVEITGEAYFEVATLYSKEKQKIPFIVNVTSGDGNMKVEVLGTHFNVMSYNDEKQVKTTLLEGAVKVSKNGNSVLLRPLQQAQLTKTNNDLRVTNDVDVNEETAWRNGIFQFNDAELSTVMRQLARWYDVDVSYSGNISADHFTGKISRNISLAKVLKILELSDVHFKIEGRKIIVIS